MDPGACVIDDDMNVSKTPAINVTSDTSRNKDL
jgi:hypothetical protein